MSSDNGIYILKCNNGSKVIYAGAIDNLEFQADESGFNHEIVKEYYEDAELLSHEDAQKKAFELEKEIGYTEYGINTIVYPFYAP